MMNSTVRITFVIVPPGMSGGTRVIAIYADKLRKRGHQVDCVVPREYIPKRSLGTWLRRRPPDISEGPNHFDELGVPYRAVNSVQDVPPADVVIATWWETAEYVPRLSPAQGTGMYFVQHHEVFEYLPVERVRQTYRMPLKKIVVSGWLRDVMAQEYGDDNVYLVENGVDPSQFFAPERTKQPTTTVGYMHSTIPFKGTALGVKAIHIARSRGKRVEVVAFGEEPRGADGPPDFVRYQQRPPQEDLRNIYSQCDAWLFTSRSEGFGLPILEAMACRTPVIGVPVGAAPDLIDSSTGFLVPRDAQSVANAICDLCEMPEPDWKVMSDSAYARASVHTWEDATNKFEAALLETAGAGPCRVPTQTSQPG